MSKGFQMTIATWPEGLNLEAELELIKVALLYADRCKLCSLNTSIIVSVIALAQMSDDEKISFIEKVMPYFTDANQQNYGEFISTFRQLMKKKRLSKQELLIKYRLKEKIKTAWVNLNSIMEDIATKAGIDKLLPALESNLLEIEVYGKGNDKIEPNDILNQFLDSIGNTVISGNTFPLFDGAIYSLLDKAIKSGRFEFSNASSERAKHGELVSDLLQRLPSFENATIDEILDVRKELSKPLIRFRAAIIGFAENIQKEPWDKGFYFETEKIFLKEIQPAVLEIEEACESNKYLKQLLIKFIHSDYTVFKNTGFGVVVGLLSELPAVTAASLGLIAGAGTMAVQTALDWKEKTEQIERQQLYFYYKVSRLTTK